MPNFFKKLTGSLRMPEEEDSFLDEEIKEKDIPGTDADREDFSSEEDFSPERQDQEFDKSDEEEPNESQTEEDSDETEEETAEPEEESEPEEDFLEVEPEKEIDILPESPEEKEENPEENKSPDSYTIAQLAQAKTAKVKEASPKKSSGSGAFNKLKSFNKKEEIEESMEPEGQLAIDVFETPTHIVIKSTIAGVKAEDLDVGIEDNVVNIRGSRHREEKTEEVDYFYQECYWGTFSRSVILPVEVDSDKAEASLNDGVLTLKIPKIIKEREKKIKVVG